MEKFKKDIYNLWAEKNPASFPYPNNKFIKEKSDPYKKFIIKNFFPSDKNINILDLGCGYGIFLNTCKEAGYKNTFGVEVIEKCLEFAREKFGIKTISNSEIEDFLEFQEDASFDVITAFDVIEHFRKDKILKLFNLIYRKLRNNGRFIMQVPNAGSLPGLYIFHSDLTHETVFTDLLLKELFHLVGFSKLEIMPEYRSKNFKNLFLNAIRRVISIIFSLNNKFSFSTNIIAVGYKNKNE